MKERPILMAAPMVRATLDDLKTQTRRVVKPAPWEVLPNKTGEPPWPHGFKYEEGSTTHGEPFKMPCPYGQPGDRLWVRETFSILDDGMQERRPVFFADMRNESEAAHHSPWKPSIFMPYWVSRILLEVTEVRVQRLNDISERDALAEGITWPDRDGQRYQPPIDTYGISGARTAAEKFQELWDSINGKRPGCTWENNPWVWAITFKRIKP